MLAVSAGPLRLSGVFPPIMSRKSGMKRSLANSATKGVIIAPFDVLACPHSGAGVTHFTVTFGSATAMTCLLLRRARSIGPLPDVAYARGVTGTHYGVADQHITLHNPIELRERHIDRQHTSVNLSGRGL